jgi:hypothetical protein
MLAEIQKGPTERLRVSVTSYRGREYIDVRVFYLDRSSEYQASRQGMTLRPALALQLIQALGLAVRSIDPKGAN